MSFSSLPTSHFTLRPSSTDAELEQSPTQFWNQSDIGYKNDSWNWNQPGSSEKMHWLKRNGSEHFSGMNGSSSRPPTPGNYGPNLIRNGNSNGVKQFPVQQQVLADQESTSMSSAESSKKDMSRSSLSVTDSKTIVLTNSPTPWHSGGGGGDRKRETDKLLSQQQQNHKLVNSTSKSHHHAVEKAEKEEASSAERRSRVSRASGDAAKVVNGGADKAKSEGGVANSRSKTEGGGGGEVVKEKAVTGTSNGGVAAAAGGNKGGVAKEKGVAGGGVARDTPPPTNKLKKVDSIKGQSPAASSALLAPPIPTSTGASSPSADVSKAASSPRDAGAEKEGVAPSGEVKEEAKKPAKVVDVWSMKGPGNGILSLNARRNTKKPLRKSENSVLGASAESALLITAQFVAKATKAPEVGGAVGVADIVPPLGGILVRGALGGRSGSSTPTILGIDMPTQQKLSGLGGVGATVSGLGRLSESNSGPLQENKVTTAKGIEVKRTKSVGADGVGVHVTLSSAGVTPHLPTASTVTNGTNFQEIFSNKRKLSENSERGLKQALSG